MLDSRASRMSPNQAHLIPHVGYIGGQHADYRKWYFAAQLDLDHFVGHTLTSGLRSFCLAEHATRLGERFRNDLCALRSSPVEEV
jgi:hypothetical protein